MPSDRVSPPGPPHAAHVQAVRARLASTTAVRAAGGSTIIRQFRYTPGQIAGWHALSQRQSTPAGLPGVLRVTRTTLAPDGGQGARTKLDVYETVSHAAARAMLVQLLTGFELLPEAITLHDSTDRASVELPHGRAHLFVRGNVAVMLLQAGAGPGDSALMAAQLDAFLTGDSEPAPGAQPAGAAATPAGAAAPNDSAAAPMLRYRSDTATLHITADGKVGAADGASAAPQVFDEAARRWRTTPDPAGPAG